MNATPINAPAIVKEGRRYIATGDTYPHRGTLRRLGFKWDPDARAWWTGKADRAEEARAAFQAADGFAPVKLDGDTYAVREDLKYLGCTFNAAEKAWYAHTPEVLARAREIIPAKRTRTVGGASDRQISYLEKRLKALARVQTFDSFTGTGEERAEEIRASIRREGGLDALTSRKASAYINDVNALIEDEM